MRLVSLCPSLTELVFDLGAGEELVGRTRFCIHPADRVGSIERVGGTKDPRVGRIVELHPDLVLMNEEENRIEDAAALATVGVTVHTSFPRRVQDVPPMVRDIAVRIGREPEGEALAGRLDRQIAATLESVSRRVPITYAYLIWRKPFMTISDDTFVSAMLELAGGRNVFGARAERYPAITEGDLAAADPDVVLLSSEPFPFTERHVGELGAALGWGASRFRLVDGELLSWHGSRTERGIAYAASLLEGLGRGRS
ncbi:MAG: helical backbone metal receptor [Gemmatimonadota bacterium]